MEEGGSFILADIFEKKETEQTRLEAMMKEYFTIEKKEIITINVKHAMNLDKPRIEKIVNSTTEFEFGRKILRNFLASADGSQTYN